MKVRVRGRWESALDPWRRPDEYLIEVSVYLCVAPVDGDAFRPERTLRQLWNYRNLGTRRIYRKIRSRLREQTFSTKFVGCGVGRIIEAPEGARLEAGDDVLFIAPNHPQGATRVTLSEDWVRKTKSFHSANTLWRPYTVVPFETFAGWSSWSGEDAPDVEWAFDKVRELVAMPPTPQTETVRDDTPVSTDALGEHSAHSTKGVWLFGFGHHARTNIVPNIPKPYVLRDVNDVDPCALLDLPHPNLHTAPFPEHRPDHCEVLISAGYHHLHAEVVCRALGLGIPVISEKPLVTNAADLERILAAAKNGPPLQVAFHKRYDIATEYLRADLPIHREPVSYHCVVHEVSLPQKHWYRWPNTGSRILSNGCHWIDHFLFLNDYCKATRIEGMELPNGEIHCAIELENDSVFSMILSDVGSDRMGTRERITINCDGHTATLVDFQTYVAEDSRRVIRNATLDKLSVYERMYPQMFQNIRKDDGDTMISITRVAEITLALDAQIR